MNLPDPEGVAEDSVELLFGNLLAVTLHAARLHHHRIAELRSVPLREVPQRIAHAQQDFRFRVRLHRGQQGFIVVEVEAARAAVGDQPVGHVDQRRTFAPQVIGQQGVEAQSGGVAVEVAECRAERLLVERQRAHRVARGRHSGGGRRSEDRLGRSLPAIDRMRLEQFDGQVRNLFRRVDMLRPDADPGEVFAVGGAFAGLAAEYFQRRGVEGRSVRNAEYVVGGDHYMQSYQKNGRFQNRIVSGSAKGFDF